MKRLGRRHQQVVQADAFEEGAGTGYHDFGVMELDMNRAEACVVTVHQSVGHGFAEATLQVVGDEPTR